MVVWLAGVMRVSAVEPAAFTISPGDLEAVFVVKSNPSKSVNISKDYVRCLYYDGKKVEYFVFTDGSRYKLSCPK
jgi:hypothetical protein